MEEERMRPPSPPPVVHYTDHEASSVAEKIKQDESFSKAVQVVFDIYIVENLPTISLLLFLDCHYVVGTW